MIQKITNLFRRGTQKRQHEERIERASERSPIKMSRAERRRLWKSSWSIYTNE
ncbi:hypothetical protein [Brevibacillus nitrificans]|uniref:hypothetical protein n=1 Tax=Brevibacillus nitrificans TaxID=651560 RepID=UPI00285EEF2F|nr:hypothetical protein [Brevibacillus nitrificans]MDR7318901.1 pSer/pThr/pTyr-binding forkhead associated (FHA) protein [Brevibacillus nitrificans]